MWPPQPGQVCRAGTSTRSRSGRGRADTLAIPRLQEIQPLQRSTPAGFASLEKGVSPPRWARSRGAIYQRHASAWIYGAVRPGTGQAFALVLTEVGTAATQAFLDRFAATLPERVHAALLLDGAGWHTAGDLAVPANVSLVFLPPYAPELDPVERIWLYLRERYLSLLLFADLDGVIEGCCDA